MDLYSLYWGTKWAMLTNKRQALIAGRKLSALVCVYAGPRDRWRGSWDAPTLRALSEPLADYREATDRSATQ